MEECEILFKYFGYLCLFIGIFFFLLNFNKCLINISLLENNYKLTFSFIVDEVSFKFFRILMIIVGRVYLFSKNYMNKDLFSNRFFYILSFFVVSMVLLIFFPHSIFVLVGYDGLGIVRFLLIDYYGRRQS